MCYMSCFCEWNKVYFTEVKRRGRCLLAAGFSLVFAMQPVRAQVSGDTVLPPSEIGIFVADSSLSITDSTYRRVIRDGSRSMNCYLSYPQGSARVLEGFGDNAGELLRLDRFLRQVFRDSLIYVDSVRLCGYCSIEGSWDVNDRLARSRALGFRSYLDGKYALSSRYPVRVDWVAEDWDKLSEMVAASDMPSCNAVLALIRDVDVFKGRERELMDLEGGVPYRYMLKEFFPALRRVEITVDYDLHRIIEEKLKRKLSEEEFRRELERERAAAEAEERRLAEAARQAEAERIAAQEAARQVAEQAVREREAARRAEEAARLEAERRAAEQARLEAERAAVAAVRLQKRENRKLHPLIGVKTDLMLWGGVMPGFSIGTWTPNLSAEVYFARRWSAQLGWAYADWDSFRGRYGLFASSTLDLEARYWTGGGEGLFRGLFVAVYGSYGDYNVQDKDSPTGQTGTFFVAGVGCGYLLPLSRHWSFEAQVRAGYRSASNELYDIETGHYYLDRKETVGEFAPQLRLQFVYRFGRGK